MVRFFSSVLFVWEVVQQLLWCFEKKVSFVLKCWNVTDCLILSTRWWIVHGTAGFVALLLQQFSSYETSFCSYCQVARVAVGRCFVLIQQQKITRKTLATAQKPQTPYKIQGHSW